MDTPLRRIRKNLPKSTGMILDFAGVILGSLIFAYAINALYRPFGFLSTGFNGVSMMLNYGLGWSIPITSFALNIVFVVAGYRYVDRLFAAKSIVGITLTSFFLQWTQGSAIPVDDPLIAIVFGGLILGTGTGIAMRSGGALGGMNILAKIVNKYMGVSVGSFDIMFNIIIVFIAGYLFDIKMAMYTIMARFVATKAIDAINEGFNRTKTIFIVSDRPNEIGEMLIKEVGRGVTFIHSHGAYTGNEKEMIYCIVRLTQLVKVKEIVKSVDEKAFMSIIDTKEVHGNGFS